MIEVPVWGGSRVVMPDVDPPHWAQAVCYTVVSETENTWQYSMLQIESFKVQKTRIMLIIPSMS